MKVSGFTFVRNAVDLGYPVVEAITSILPLCDEFVVATGDSTDGTTELLRSIGSPKLRLIETAWDPALFVRGAIFAQQTDVALAACSGDWAFYIQADEVVHERDLPRIEARLRRHLDDPRVEGLLFDYFHFFGDFDHVQTSHNWYGREIRVVRTGIGVSSWHDAQGFRRNGEKLRVAHSDAAIYHYGWVRPPDHMKRKGRAFAAAYVGAEQAAARPEEPEYRYGRLWGLRRFAGTHPAVMRERIARQDWTVKPSPPVGHKHDRFGVQVLTYLENYLLGFRVGERRNYVLVPGLDAETPRRLPPVGRP
jgi:glycosyltransferase involved in cell wall biosynthesis